MIEYIVDLAPLSYYEGIIGRAVREYANSPLCLPVGIGALSLYIMRYLLEPFDELFDCCTEGLLCLAVVEDTRFIELCLAAMPLNDEFILEEDLVTDDQLHEGRCELNLLWEALYEE